MKSTKIKVKDPEKLDYAYLLYINKVPHKEICEKVGISANTLTKWKNDSGWEMKRAAKEISTEVLVGKALMRINEMLDSEEFKADAFAKAVAQLKTLKQDETIDSVVNILTKFGEWLMTQSTTNKSVDTPFVKLVNEMQSQYINERLKHATK